MTLSLFSLPAFSMRRYIYRERDISEQLKFEDEEFLLGLKDQKQDQDGVSQQDKEPKKKDEGIEMEHDFEGELFDVISSDENDDEDDQKRDEMYLSINRCLKERANLSFLFPSVRMTQRYNIDIFFST